MPRNPPGVHAELLPMKLRPSAAGDTAPPEIRATYTSGQRERYVEALASSAVFEPFDTQAGVRFVVMLRQVGGFQNRYVIPVVDNLSIGWLKAMELESRKRRPCNLIGISSPWVSSLRPPSHVSADELRAALDEAVRHAGPAAGYDSLDSFVPDLSSVFTLVYVPDAAEPHALPNMAGAESATDVKPLVTKKPRRPMK